MDKFNNMKEKNLEQILTTYKNKSNKDLANILVTLEVDFNNIKKIVLEVSDTLEEVETVYDLVYAELQHRMKFEDKKDES